MNEVDTRPTKLARAADGALEIEWSDGRRRRYTVRELRDACPCASCREKRSEPATPSSGLQILSVAETRPLQLTAMEPMGNYAYSLTFSDGHDTGIYTLDLLRSLGKESS
jgi:DUF971 family protein